MNNLQQTNLISEQLYMKTLTLETKELHIVPLLLTFVCIIYIVFKTLESRPT